MKKSKSIKILENLIAENKNENSLIKIRSYISDFFGKESPEYLFIKKFRYTFKEDIIFNPITKTKTKQYNQQEIQNIFQNKEIKLNEFLKNCIETIVNKGLCNHKNMKNDFRNSNIGNLVQESENTHLYNPIQEKTVHTTERSPQTKSIIEIAAWVVSIIAGGFAIYKFIIEDII
jgi:hypothetical protein